MEHLACVSRPLLLLALAASVAGCESDAGPACGGELVVVDRVRLPSTPNEADRMGFDLEPDPGDHRDNELGFALSVFDLIYPGTLERMSAWYAKAAVVNPARLSVDRCDGSPQPISAMLGHRDGAAAPTTHALRLMTELDRTGRQIRGRVGLALDADELVSVREALALHLTAAMLELGEDRLDLDADRDQVITAKELLDQGFARALLAPDLDLVEAPALSFALEVIGHVE